MKPRVSAMVLLAATAGALSISSLPARETPSEKSAQELARALQGRTAGQPVTCIPNFRGQARMEVIDDGTILFREGSTLYLQRPSSECRGIDDGGYTLVSRHYGNQQLCSGDIQQLVELTTGIQAGSCTFGPFVPYRKPG
jgi:hypothetical protein